MINYNIEIEKTVICGLINYPDLIFNSGINITDFYFEKNQKIFEIIRDNSGKEIDITIIAEKLGKDNLKEIGGLSYLVDISSNFIGGQSFISYVNILKDKAIRREIDIANKMNTAILEDERKDINDILSTVQKNIMDINIVVKEDASGKNAVMELNKAQLEFGKKYEKGDKYIGIPCGLSRIDDIIDGFREGHLWMIGAWASTGKSSFLLNLIHNIIKKTPTTLISLEMSIVDIVAKLIGIRHKISSQKIIKGMVNTETEKKIKEGKEFICNSKLNIYTKYFKLEEIKMLIRKEVYTKKTKVVAIDYVQNIVDSKMKEYDLLTKVAIDMQSLARELEITIILLSQVSNDSIRGAGAGAGFKGTGAFEAVADLAIRLYRDKEKEDLEADSVPLTIKIEKNRHGFTGVVNDYELHLKSGRLINTNKVKIAPPDNIEF